MSQCHIMLHSATAEPRFYVSVGATQNGIKFGTVGSSKYCSYGWHIARAVQKVCKIAENKMQRRGFTALFRYLKTKLHLRFRTQPASRLYTSGVLTPVL
jgi:hypothetical protein